MSQDNWNEETGCQPPEAPAFCKSNCGFFGSAATMDLCSKCYHDLVLNQTKSSTISEAEVCAVQAVTDLFKEGKNSGEPVSLVDSVPHGLSEPGVRLSIGGPSSSESSNEHPFPTARSNRCLMCKKLLGLMGFKCRCGDVFCALHRYSDAHRCTYDYKANGREAISKENPVVKADKITRI